MIIKSCHDLLPITATLKNLKFNIILLAEFYWYKHGTVILIYSNNSKNSDIKTETEADNEP